jgi:competence protein ComGF
MSSIYESFLRATHTDNIQEWFTDLKSLLESLEDIADPNTEDIQLAFHLTQMIESFELFESNLVERRRGKQQRSDGLYENRSTGSSVLFD